MITSKNSVVTPFQVYKLLFKYFGPQGWWPVTKAGMHPQYYPLLYERNSEKEKCEICIGAILTQNTSWKNVEKAVLSLSKHKVLGLDKISVIKTDFLAQLIRSSGYYNQKAARLKDFAKYICENYKGSLILFFNRPLEIIRKELLKLKGIGPETADSMLLYSGSKLSFVIDAYTYRMGSRLGWLKDKNYDTAQNFFKHNIPEVLNIYNEYHALIAALCKNFCKKKPVCNECPLKEVCLWGK